MRKLAVTAFAILMASSAFAQTESVSLDGSWWVKASVTERVLWLVGYVDGFTDALRLAASMKSENDNLPMSVAGRLKLRNVRRYSVANPQMLTNDAITGEMTLFYKDFRNTPVCWSDAEVVAELALTGGAPSEVDLGALRAEDAKSGCEKFPIK
ncbi:MAG: hypothetical protein WA450_09285 [Candidatus Acidiferrales bacterium]